MTINIANSVAITITMDTESDGNGQAGASIDNSTLKHEGALVSLLWKAGTSPTIDKLVDVFLVRIAQGETVGNGLWDGTNSALNDDRNLQHLGSFSVTATTGANYRVTFDTAPLGPLGQTWSIVVINNTGATSDTTAGNFEARYEGYSKE